MKNSKIKIPKITPRFVSICVIAIGVIFVFCTIVKNNKEGEAEYEVTGEDFVVTDNEFPDKAVVDKYKNPILYDTYNGIFGAHFNTSYLKGNDYKLLVLNSDSSYYLFDDYYHDDNMYSGVLGGNFYTVKTNDSEKLSFERFKNERKADLVEKFNGYDFYFYVLSFDEFDIKTRSVDGIGIQVNPNNDWTNPIRNYFEYFGYPVEWCKLTCNKLDWTTNFDSPFWNDYNYMQDIVCYKVDEPSDEIHIYVTDTNEFYFQGDEYSDVKILDKTLEVNGYCTTSEGIANANEKYKEYFVELF